MNADNYSQNLKSDQSGFTIVETLVAMVVVSVMLAAIAPVVILSVGNRVQARRIELATQAARTYIAGVKTGAIAPPSHTVELNEVDNNKNFSFQRTKFAGEAPPVVAGLDCPSNGKGFPYCEQTPTSSLYCFDLDSGGCNSDNAQDLIVQAFRSVTPNSTDTKRGYLLGVRVYRADAFSDTIPLVFSEPENKRTQATFTGGMGNSKAPLLETTTEIVPQKATFKDFCDRLGGCN